MSNYNLTKKEITWLMEDLARQNVEIKENCGCGQTPCKTYGAQPDTNMTITGQPDHSVYG